MGPTKIIIVITGVLSLVSLAYIFQFLNTRPTTNTIHIAPFTFYPLDNSSKIDLDQPIEFFLSENETDVTSVNVTPNTKISVKSNINPNRLTIRPDKFWQANTNYLLKVSSSTNSAKTYHYTFSTTSAPASPNK